MAYITSLINTTKSVWIFCPGAFSLLERPGLHGLDFFIFYETILLKGLVHETDYIGNSFDFDTERGKICPMAMHVAFPYIDILRYGGKLPLSEEGDFRFCCPDVDVINVFKTEVEE